MIIAIVNEISAADKNADILSALEGRNGIQVMNAGMKKSGETPGLTYIHTGLMAALLLNLGCADIVVGGCGTGQGFLNSAMQYPGVFCGHITNSLDAWLFAQINGGNCISLALNQGYGWAGDVNLRFIFDRLFSVEHGVGYPAHRKESQKESRYTLSEVSKQTHRPFYEIIASLPDKVLLPVLQYPGFLERLNLDAIENLDVKTVIFTKFCMS